MAMTLLLNILFCLCSCSLFFPTTRIQVPKGYVGWCYVVPSPDTSRLIEIDRKSGLYKIDSHGVAYVPVSHLDLKNDNVVEVYEGGKEVTAYTRYSGKNETTLRDKTYEYISFLLPAPQEREIDNDEYWRRKGYENTVAGMALFDSLLQNNLISIKARPY
ncbi:MAG: hypothetical protein J0H74_24030 [Chitinophagaceae bacterium]|nr:hypothetical protein [Chitinophagaceae bacterium]